MLHLLIALIKHCTSKVCNHAGLLCKPLAFASYRYSLLSCILMAGYSQYSTIATASDGYGEGISRDWVVQFEADTMPLQALISSLQEQTQLDFIYIENGADSQQPIRLPEAEPLHLSQVLDAISEQAHVDFSLSEGKVAMRFQHSDAAASTTQEGAATVAAISGKVVDAASREAIADAFVVIRDAADFRQSTKSTGDGSYAFKGIPPGAYEMVAVVRGYRATRITDITVTPNQELTLALAMEASESSLADEEEFTSEEDVFMLDAIEVTAIKATDIMIKLELQKTSTGIMNIQLSEDFTRFAASDISEAIEKVSGVTTDDGFAIVRGLEERFSVTTLNGMVLPPLDPDRPAVPLDIFPTGLFESVAVTKTFSPDMPGEASGGQVDLRMISIPEERIIKFSFGTGYNENSQDRWLTTAPSGTLDYFASGAADRNIEDLPTDYVNTGFIEQTLTGTIIDSSSEPGSTVSADFKEGLRELINVQAFPDDAPLDHSFSFLYADSFSLGDASKVGLVFSALSKSNARYRRTFDTELTSSSDSVTSAPSRLEAIGIPTADPGYYVDEFGERGQEIATLESQLSGFAGVALEINERHQIENRTVFNRNGTQNAQLGIAGSTWRPDAQNVSDVRGLDNVLLDGVAPVDALPAFISYSDYIQQTLLLNQVAGSHDMSDKLGISIDWGFAYSDGQQEEPLTAFVPPPGGSGIPPTTAALLVERNTDQTALVGRADLTFHLHEYFDFLPGASLSSSSKSLLKLGVAIEDTDRSFLQQTAAASYRETINTGITPSGTLLIDFTADRQGPYDLVVSGDADGFRKIQGYYAMLDMELSEWLQLSGGMRIEQTELSFDGSGQSIAYPDITVEVTEPRPIDETDVLPSLNITIKPSDKIQARFAVSQTIARPTFRELAPYPIDNLSVNEVEIGNPGVVADGSNLFLPDEFAGLEQAHVTNFDVRAEWYPHERAVYSIGVFHKTIEDPIERVFNRIGSDIIASGAGDVYTFINNDNEATLRGIELEAEDNLGVILKQESLEFLSFGANLTIFDGKVKRSLVEQRASDSRLGITADDERPIVNQPDLLANLYLNTNFERTGTDITLSANYQGERLVGTAGGSNPDEFTADYWTLNLVWSQDIPWVDGLKFTFSAENLTNPAIERFVTTELNPDGPSIVTERGEVVEQYTTFSFKEGRSFKFALSYEF